MRKFWFQTKLNTKRLIIRDIKTVFFALFFPLFFYVLYTRIFVFEMPEEALIVWQTDYMLSMIIFGFLFTSVNTLANTLLEDYTNQFQLFVRLTPTSKWRYFLSVILVYMPVNLTLIGALGLLAYFLNGVALGLIEWLVLILLLLFGTAVFSLLGVIVSYGRKTTIVNLLGNLIVFPLAIAGGLWWPLDMMPDWLNVLGKRLLTNHMLVLTQDWVHEKSFAFSAFIGILIWLFLLVVVIIGLQKVFKYRESD